MSKEKVIPRKKDIKKKQGTANIVPKFLLL
jgi:hypothetical protein